MLATYIMFVCHTSCMILGPSTYSMHETNMVLMPVNTPVEDSGDKAHVLVHA